jgi:SHS2 domain-containing protein
VYRWIEHTAELELNIEASNREGVFEDALLAFRELVAPEADKGEAATQVVVAQADDPETLLAEWLSELVYLAETTDFIPERLEELSLRKTSLRAVVAGRLGQAAPLVKAVTYHRLELRREADGWHGRLVLDV